MKKSLLIITLVIVTTVCFSQEPIKLAPDQYKKSIELLEKAKKNEVSEIKRHQKNVTKYKKEIKHLKKLVKLVK